MLRHARLSNQTVVSIDVVIAHEDHFFQLFFGEARAQNARRPGRAKHRREEERRDNQRSHELSHFWLFLESVQNKYSRANDAIERTGLVLKCKP